MGRGLANVISYALHPVIFPIMGVFLILKTLPYHVSPEALLLAMAFVFTGTYILPVSVSFLFYKVQIISSIHMKESKDRRWPYLVGAIFYYITATFLRLLNLPVEAHLFLTASALIILLHLLLLKYLKPSAHMAGIGGFTGLLMALSLRYQMGFLPFLALCIVLAGLLGSARLKLSAHGMKELAVGYFSGILIVLLTVLIS